MNGLDRRRLLYLSMAMLPALASRPAAAEVANELELAGTTGAVTPTGAAGTTGGPIAPPPQPMVYTRRIERTLVGNARIVVERKFAIRFTRLATGFVVDGQQIAVSVEMPKELAALSEMERERVETGIFPLELDEEGHIRSGEGAGAAPEIDTALAYVSQTLAGLDRTEDQRQPAQGLHRRGPSGGQQHRQQLADRPFRPAAERSVGRALDRAAGRRRGHGFHPFHRPARPDHRVDGKRPGARSSPALRRTSGAPPRPSAWHPDADR